MNRYKVLVIALALLALGTRANPVSANALDHLQTQDDIGLNKIPHVGTSHILVIPSRVGVEQYPAQHLEKLRKFFATEGGPGTFRHYWQVVSGGVYDPIPTVIDPVLFPDSCPIPGRSLDDCKLTLTDSELLTQGIGRGTFVNVLEAARKNGVDFSLFDVNGAEGKGSDGFFDGIIVESDLANGIAFPLGALASEVTVGLRSRDDDQTITCGIVALAPPELHEFAHTFGFMDLYGGPTLNDLMSDIKSTLSAYSRKQIGWGDVVQVKASGETIDLSPVLDGGAVLQVGTGPTYMMVENRAGQWHDMYEGAPAGIYVYSIDLHALPKGPLGFIDLSAQQLYLPNEAPPYLAVNMPIDCSLTKDAPDAGSNACAMTRAGETRELVHADGTSMQLSVRLDGVKDDGTARITFFDPKAEGSGSGCSVGGRSGASSGIRWWTVMGSLCGVLVAGRRRHDVVYGLGNRCRHA